jgi:hypothetical protein
MVSVASFVVVPKQNSWGIEHDHQMLGPYLTREAAFEAAIGAASNAIKNGDEVRIVVKAPGDRPAMGFS